MVDATYADELPLDFCELTKEQLGSYPVPSSMAVYKLPHWLLKYLKLVDKTSVLYTTHSDCSSLKLIRCTTHMDKLTDDVFSRKSSIDTCTFSSDGSKIFTVDTSEEVSVYHISQEGLQKDQTTRKAEHLLVLPGGRILVQWHSNINVWDSDFRKLLWTWTCVRTPLCVTDEVVAFRGMKRGGLTVRDLKTGDEMFQLQGLQRPLVHCRMDPLNSRILTSDPCTLILWDMDSHKQKKYHQFGYVCGYSISSELKLIALCCSESHMYILNELDGEILRHIDISSAMYPCGFVYGTDLFVCHGRTGLHVVNVYIEKVGSVMCGHVRRQIPYSPVSCSPRSRKIAVAQDSGKLLLLEFHLPRYRPRICSACRVCVLLVIAFN